MHFEWDRAKAHQNLVKHQVSFEEAITVFFDPLSATFRDPDHSRDEDRYITFGHTSRHRLLVVSHGEKDKIIGIISARRATAHERKRHEG